jgi:hypothetical protein
MDMATFSERDSCTKVITPAPRKEGWDEMSHIPDCLSAELTCWHSSDQF